MTALATATALVQLVAVGKELVDLFEEGQLSEDEVLARWNKNATNLAEREAQWKDRQKTRTQASKAGT